MHTGQTTEMGEWLFAQQCNFISGAADYSGIPVSTLPEIAFVGRSNVGKSSLVNALVNRLSLARVSNTPGRTRQLNFFSLADKLMLVDLPGYGYAKAPKGEIKGWTTLVKNYLKGRAALKRVCVLVDARHGTKDSDDQVMSLLDDKAISYQIVLTKVDKISNTDLSKLLERLQGTMSSHPAMYPHIAATSSWKKLGLQDLRQDLAKLVQ